MLQGRSGVPGPHRKTRFRPLQARARAAIAPVVIKHGLQHGALRAGPGEGVAGCWRDLGCHAVPSPPPRTAHVRSPKPSANNTYSMGKHAAVDRGGAGAAVKANNGGALFENGLGPRAAPSGRTPLCTLCTPLVDPPCITPSHRPVAGAASLNTMRREQASEKSATLKWCVRTS